MRQPSAAFERHANSKPPVDRRAVPNLVRLHGSDFYSCVAQIPNAWCYLEYVGFLYADRVNALTPEDSRRSFSGYVEDATKRAQHDAEFPNEIKQLRPGENVQTGDGRVQISGQVAVMAINEQLFQRLMEKNPDLSFAIEESFPFKSTYSEATVAGPLMELRTGDERAMTAERAGEAVNYWRSTTEQVLADSAAMESTAVRQAYSKMAAAQASLLVDRKYTAQAEQTYQLAAELCPWSPEVVFRYVELLAQQDRIGEALAVVNNALQTAPEGEPVSQFQSLADSLKNASRANSGVSP